MFIMISKQQYRSEIRIIADILSVIRDAGREGIIVSAISRSTNTSYKAINEKCQKLIDARLVESTKNNRNRSFVITEKGMSFFEQLQQFAEMTRTLNMRY